MAELPYRKRNRLEGYDYSAPGAYFVTICTHEKRCILGSVAVGEGLAPPAVNLTAVGRIVASQIEELPKRYPMLVVENYAVMPNHVHLLLRIVDRDHTGGASPSPTVPGAISYAGGASPSPTVSGAVSYAGGASPSPTVSGAISCAGGASPSPTVSDMVCTFKSLSARLARDALSGAPLWQRSFHDHVVRDEREYQMIWEYIDGNAAKWADDCYFQA